MREQPVTDDFDPADPRSIALKGMLAMYAIYHNPKDHPGKFVVRGWVIGRGERPLPTSLMHVVDTLDEARAKVPPGLMRWPPHSSDDPSVIVETWF